jgi:LmbE family N-acetylglucosaminyl deacetylase
VVAPHPDDEVVGAGGLLALELAAGRRTEVVVVTDGAGAPQAGSPRPAAELADVRRGECEEGLRRLGDCPVTFLSRQSAALGDPAGREATARALAACLSRLAPGDVLVTAPFESHLTHRRVTELTLGALRRSGLTPAPRLWGYPVWGSLWGDAGVAIVDISAVAQRKRHAIAAHRSQCEWAPFDEGTLAGNRHDAVFLDSHAVTAPTHVERFLDLTPLVEDAALTLEQFTRERVERTLAGWYRPPPPP